MIYVQKFIFRRFPVSALVGKLWNIKLSFRWLFCSDIIDVRLSEYSFQYNFKNSILILIKFEIW